MRTLPRLGHANLYLKAMKVEVVLAENVISQTRCRKFLAGDGITTPEFTINTSAGIVEGLSLDARTAKKSLPAYGNVFSVAKNLDEYQYKLCVLVPSLPDSPAKITLQKYRIAIAAAFAKLAAVIRENSDTLQMWIMHACSLLIEASNAYVRATTGDNHIQKPAISSALAFFGLQEDDVDRYLAHAYS